MKNLQIQVGVMKTIILFIKTTTKGSIIFKHIVRHTCTKHVDSLIQPLVCLLIIHYVPDRVD